MHSPPYANLPVSRDRRDTPGPKKVFPGDVNSVGSLSAMRNERKDEPLRSGRKVPEPVGRGRKNMSVTKRARQLMNLGGTERTFAELPKRYVTKTPDKERPTSQGHTAKSTAPSTLISSAKSKAPPSNLSFQTSGSGVTKQRSENRPRYADPTEEMVSRWIKLIKRRVPTIDLVDISAEVFPFNAEKR